MSATRWEQLLRYRFIEIIALWEGRLTTRHLCEVFGIGRQQASKDINNYKRSIGPGNLEYDGTAKGYRPSATLRHQSPRKNRGVSRHSGWRQRDAANSRAVTRLLTATEVLSVPTRQIPPSILRPLILARRITSG